MSLPGAPEPRTGGPWGEPSGWDVASPRRAGDGCWGVRVHSPEGLQIPSSGDGRPGVCALRCHLQASCPWAESGPLEHLEFLLCGGTPGPVVANRMGRGPKPISPCVRPRCVLSTDCSHLSMIMCPQGRQELGEENEGGSLSCRFLGVGRKPSHSSSPSGCVTGQYSPTCSSSERLPAPHPCLPAVLLLCLLL